MIVYIKNIFIGIVDNKYLSKYIFILENIFKYYIINTIFIYYMSFNQMV